MMSLVYAACPSGVEAVPVTVEVDVRHNKLRVSIVGLPDVATRESKDRLIPAITNSGFALDRDEVVINLGPADLRKEGTAFDLAMAVGVLVSKGIVDPEKVAGHMLLGELALDGGVRPVRGILAATECASKMGFKGIVVPKSNASEASLVTSMPIFAIESLSEYIQHLRGRKALLPIQGRGVPEPVMAPEHERLDFSDVKGQFAAKRMLEIAAAGKHNVLMFGPPGSGKSMLGKRLPGILPPMGSEEVIEVTRIYSCVGKLPSSFAVMKRPFRAPHHTASSIAMVGGGTHPRPGEVTQAHRGVLFLDEFPEFPRMVLEVLRQPLEDREVTISRATNQVTFPADFMLVAAMNPCPCGFRGDPRRHCSCTCVQVKNYMSKLSGPLLDRIDLHLEVPSLPVSQLRKMPPSESSERIRERVAKARAKQLKRFGTSLVTNATMPPPLVERHCYLPQELMEWLDEKVEAQGCSKRVHDKILRVARTIADLADRDFIEANDLMEALGARQLDYGNIPVSRAVGEVV